jgi:hypothetical protein
MTDEEFFGLVASLWEQSLGNSNGLRLTAGPFSGNNRVFFAETIERRAVVKWYFRGPVGSRDRMDSDWGFLTFTNAAGIKFAPMPYACDPKSGLVLMEWIEGEKFVAERITSDEIHAAAEFLRQLNSHSDQLLIAKIPEAAEARFTTVGHFNVMDSRLSRLSFNPESEVEFKAVRLVVEMRKFWEQIRPSIAEDLSKLGVDQDMPIPRSLQCLSPADFGFHNAIRQRDGGLRFFDFEYAGWDDPAKTLCDFFLSPSIPVPLEFWREFTSQAFANWPNQALIQERADILFPLFSLKWCCIMLNAFVGDLASPGVFASPVYEQGQRKALQLYKAERAFSVLLERTRLSMKPSRIHCS